MWKKTGFICVVVTTALAMQEVEMRAKRQTGTFGAWSAASSLEAIAPFAHSALNTAALEGCPAVSVDGRYLFMASNRPGSAGLDLWVSQRGQPNDPWGAPSNLGPAVNTPANEFCPTPLPDGRTLLFVSTRPGGCGGGDIYYTSWLGGNSFTERCFGRGEQSRRRSQPIPRDAGPCTMGALFLEHAGGRRTTGDAGGTRRRQRHLYRRHSAERRHRSALSRARHQHHVRRLAAERPKRRQGNLLRLESARLAGRRHLDVRARAGGANVEPADQRGRRQQPGERDSCLSFSDGTTLYLGSTRSDAEGSSDLYMATRVRLGAR